ncbi:hypothetical protein N474_22720 [Pseudoalteromonas luteoviolacea CPMOR-2]|nr:hypothetical protein N474_22720 [Pseudoalteromonas luteoviolacea CPMOR-2]
MFGLQAWYSAKQTNCITSTEVKGTEIEHSKITNNGCSLNKRVRVKSNIKAPTKTNAISQTEACKQYGIIALSFTLGPFKFLAQYIYYH